MMVPYITKCLHCKRSILNESTRYPAYQLCPSCVSMHARALARDEALDGMPGDDGEKLPVPKTIIEELQSCISDIDSAIDSISSETSEMLSMRYKLDEMIKAIKGESVK